MYDADEAPLGGGTVAKAPPYIAFKTTMTLIEELRTNGLPPQIDRSVLKRFSGGVGSQIQMALRSLGLTDDKNRPTDDLARLVKADDPEEFKRLFRPVIERTYPFLADLDLKVATPSMFAEAFKKGIAAKEDVLRKCRTFYLHAAQFVGIEIGPRLLNGSFPRAPSSSTGVKRRPKVKSTGDGGSGGFVPPATSSGGGGGFSPERFSDADAMAMLVAKMDMTKMSDVEQEAVWTLLRYLKKQEAERSKPTSSDPKSA